MMSRGLNYAAAVLLAGCVSAPIRQAATPSPEEEVALARSRTRLSTALIDADAAAAGNVFAADAVFMNPNNPDVQGRETIEARFRGIKKGVIRVLNFTPAEIVMCGDRAYDLGVFEEEIAPPESRRSRTANARCSSGSATRMAHGGSTTCW